VECFERAVDTSLGPTRASSHSRAWCRDEDRVLQIGGQGFAHMTAILEVSACFAARLADRSTGELEVQYDPLPNAGEPRTGLDLYPLCRLRPFPRCSVEPPAIPGAACIQQGGSPHGGLHRRDIIGLCDC
jgi:hypothetical protein